MKRGLSAIFVLLFSVSLWAQSATLKISEVMYCPASGGAEYVELYNDGGEAVDLSGVCLARMRGDSINRLYPLSSEHRWMEGFSYYVFTKDSADIVHRFAVKNPSHIVVPPSMPPLVNNAGFVVLCNGDSSVIEHFEYSDALHNTLLSNLCGVALERRDFGIPVSSADNWSSASSLSGYGTPTYANSVCRDTTADGDDFSISSQIVSPDGDGVHDEVEITYSLVSDNLMANITIVNARGHIVRHLLRNASLGAAGVILWDGKDNAGACCPRGNYILLIEPYDMKGTRKMIKHVISVVY